MLSELILFTILFYIIICLFGITIGSFLNVCIYRIPKKENIATTRSHCMECNTQLKWYDLVPLFSWLFLRGKCRYCKAKLSARHLWLEIISAIAFLSILLKYDISLQTLEYLIFTCLLMACAFADLEGTIIPDRFIIAGLIVRLGFILINGDFVKDGYHSNGDPFYSDVSNYNVNITYNSDLILASSGNVVEENVEENTKTSTIKAKAIRDFAFVLSSKFNVVSGSINNITVFRHIITSSGNWM